MQGKSEHQTMTISFPEQFNMANYFLDDRVKEGKGAKVAVYYRDERYTCAEVQQMANRVGNALIGSGVEMEDRVLVVLPDCVEFVATWFAVAKIGAVTAMVNTIMSRWRPAANSYQHVRADHLQRRAHSLLEAGAALGQT
jgi:acyl-coenzyme A synthetase/AMP-(fatty) acid ligase